MYVRQAAWLAAIPVVEAKSKVRQISRLERHKNDGVPPSYPPIDAGEHLIEYLFEIGPTLPGAMGEVPITHVELRAWQENVGIDLQSWEAKLLHRLSSEYLGQLHKATDPACKPPFGQLYRAPNLSKKIDAALD